MTAPLTYPALTPALAVNDCAAALDFYRRVFDAEERYRLIDPENGKIGHAEFTIGGQVLMIAEEYPAFNQSPTTLGGTAVKFSIMVADVDAAFARAVAAGAVEVYAPRDEFYGHRSASVRDPFGHVWMLQREIESVTPEEMQRRWDAMAKP